jgi:hypothetical protein
MGIVDCGLWIVDCGLWIVDLVGIDALLIGRHVSNQQPTINNQQ